jgi:hypothetical protein
MLTENIKADSEQLNKEQRGKRLSPSTLVGSPKAEPEGLGTMRTMAAQRLRAHLQVLSCTTAGSESTYGVGFHQNLSQNRRGFPPAGDHA